MVRNAVYSYKTEDLGAKIALNAPYGISCTPEILVIK